MAQQSLFGTGARDAFGLRSSCQRATSSWDSKVYLWSARWKQNSTPALACIIGRQERNGKEQRRGAKSAVSAGDGPRCAARARKGRSGAAGASAAFSGLWAQSADGTLIDHEDNSHAAMKHLLASLPASARLVYATGRSLQLCSELVHSGVPLCEPTALICSVGTRIYSGSCLHTADSASEDESWREQLLNGWDRDAAARCAKRVGNALSPQADSEQTEFKLSFTGDFDSVQKLRSELEAAQLNAKVIFSCGKDVDILPNNAGKGNAVRHLLSKYAQADGVSYSDFASRALVCGDSGNDIAMLGQRFVKACIVGNSQQELLDWFKRDCNSDAAVHPSGRASESIMHALHHFGLLPPPDE